MAQEAAATSAVATAPFSDRLAEAVERKRTQLVVGLDPRPDLLPVELRGDAHLGRDHVAAAVARFCCGIVDAVAPHVVAVKPQLAFFEALGADGVRALEETCAYARAAGLLVIADAKRGDIGSTSRAYAAAYLESTQSPVRGGETDDEPPAALVAQPPLADALTVNPYLGRDSLDPFLLACRREGAGLFCLVKTSNAGWADVQDVALRDGRPLWQHVAALVRDWGEDLVGERGLSSVGAVVGATHPRAVGEARRLMPQSVLLLPGVGAQGATPADVARAFTSGPASALVTAARSVIFAHRAAGGDWRSAAGAEAARLRSEVWAVAGW
jgi:orotidine-5'-phosphate decarboxylase